MGRNDVIAAKPSNSVVSLRRSKKSPGGSGKSTTLRLRRSDQTVPSRAGVVVGQRPQQHRVHDAEDGGRGADAERDRQDGGDGKRRLASQAAERKQNVADKRFHGISRSPIGMFHARRREIGRRKTAQSCGAWLAACS